MPTVFKFKKIKFIIYVNDHGPAHIHAVRGKKEAEAKIDLNTCECYWARGFDKKAVKEIEKNVRENRNILLDEWEFYHGKKRY